MTNPKDGLIYRSCIFISKTAKVNSKTNKIIAEFMGAEIGYFTDNESKACDNVTYVCGYEADRFRNSGKWWNCKFPGWYSHPDDTFSPYFADELKYHDSWDWLMHVVDKIEKIYKTDNRIPSFKISAQSVWFYLPDYSVKTQFASEPTPTAFYEVAGCYSEAVEKIKFDTKMEAIYYVVVKFIEWYNE